MTHPTTWVTYPRDPTRMTRVLAQSRNSDDVQVGADYFLSAGDQVVHGLTYVSEYADPFGCPSQRTDCWTVDLRTSTPLPLRFVCGVLLCLELCGIDDHVSFAMPTGFCLVTRSDSLVAVYLGNS